MSRLWSVLTWRIGTEASDARLQRWLCFAAAPAALLLVGLALSKLTTTAGDAATGFLAASAVAVLLVIVGIVVTVIRLVRMNLNRNTTLNLKIKFIDDDGPTIGDMICAAKAERSRRLRRINRLGFCVIVASLIVYGLSHWLFAGRNFDGIIASLGLSHWTFFAGRNFDIIVSSIHALPKLLFALGFTILLAGPWWVYFRNRAA